MPELEAKVDQLLEGHRETRQTLREMTAAINKLAVIEERQTNSALAIDRAFREMEQVEINATNGIAKLDERVKKLEEVSPLNSMANGMVFKVGGFVLAAVVGAFLSSVVRPVPPPPIMIQGAPASAAPTTGAPPK